MQLIPAVRLAPLVLCAGIAAAGAQEQVTADTVVATVNGVEITAGHLMLMRAQLPDQYQSLPDAALYDGLIQQAISQELLAQTVDEIGRAAELALENEARVMRANIAMSLAAESAVTEAALQAAYDAAYGDAEPGTEYHAAHILVETEAEAANLKTKADGGADFAALAREHSTGPSGPNGGDLGWFEPGMMVPEFSAAVIEMAPGAVSAPVETQFGWHVIKLIETRETPVPSFDEVRETLAGDIQDQAVQDRLDTLRAAAEVTETTGGAITPNFLSDPTLLQE